MTQPVYLRYPGGLKKAFTMSYDDGVEQDARLIDIMRANGLKGTFNLNSGLYAPEGTVYPAGTIHRRMGERRVTELYSASGMEVAAHAYEHPSLTEISREDCEYQVIKDRETLEAQFGRIVRGMAYPFGTFNDEVVDVLRECGIAYCRTVISTHGFGLPDDWLRLAATCHHDDPELQALVGRFLSDEPSGEPFMFYLWGHSYEFEANDNWRLIEALAEKIGGRSDIWYATNIELYDYIEAFRALQASADGRRLYNPTALDLLIEREGKIRELASGKELLF